MKAILKHHSLMSYFLTSCVFLLPMPATAATNVPPTVTIQSVAMRPGTTLMDVTYRITDPDDPTVKVRALVFVNGVRSFANVIRPVTFVDGTSSNLGDTVTTNVSHTLTWDVAADWNIQLGQVKFEVLAVDSNGVIPFQGITIPAAAGQTELKINQIGLTDAQVLNALFWFYASGNAYMEVVNGTLMGSASSGVFRQKPVVAGSAVNQDYARQYLSKVLNISLAGTDLFRYAENATRTQFAKDTWLTTNRPYVGTQFLYGWGNDYYGEASIPRFFCEVATISAGNQMNLALKSDGTVVGWGHAGHDQTNVPAGLSGVTAIAAGYYHCLALKKDGTVVAWGREGDGRTIVPEGLSGVTAIATGFSFSLALKYNGTVVAWGDNSRGQTTIPEGLGGVTAIAAGDSHCLALKSDGTVVGWGFNDSGQTTPPEGLTGVTAIAAGDVHSLALKNDGTVVAWGSNDYGQTTVPAELSGVTAIAASCSHCLALKNDGTLVAWGDNSYGSTTIPAGLSNVTAIAGGRYHCIATTKAP